MLRNLGRLFIYLFWSAKKAKSDYHGHQSVGNTKSILSISSISSICQTKWPSTVPIESIAVCVVCGWEVGGRWVGVIRPPIPTRPITLNMMLEVAIVDCRDIPEMCDLVNFSSSNTGPTVLLNVNNFFRFVSMPSENRFLFKYMPYLF